MTVHILVIPGQLLLVAFGVILLATTMLIWLWSRRKHASSRRHKRARRLRTA